MTYHDDGSTSTQRVTGEKVYFRDLQGSRHAQPPVATSQEMVEVEVEDDELQGEAQPATSGLRRLQGGGRAWRVEGARVYHARRDCPAIRNARMVFEIQKCSACWGRNEMDTTGEIYLADGTGHRSDRPHGVDGGRMIRPCEKCRRA